MSAGLRRTWAERLGVLAFAVAAPAVVAALAALGYSRIPGAFEPPSAYLTDTQQARHALQSAVEFISGVLLLTGVLGVVLLAGSRIGGLQSPRRRAQRPPDRAEALRAGGRRRSARWPDHADSWRPRHARKH